MGDINMEAVAQMCGVSAATVSRVINNKRNVSESTRLKVLGAIEKLNYQPNMLGRNLRESRSRLVVMLIPFVDNPFCSKVVNGVQEVTSRNGYNLMLAQTQSRPACVMEYLSLLQQRLIDGIIVLDFPQNMEHYRDQFPKNLPIIQCSDAYADWGLPYVTIDNRRSAINVVRYLLSIGRSQIALINSDPKYQYALLREDGYRQALGEAGLTVCPEWVYHLTEIDFNIALSAARELLSCSRPPDSVFAVSDVYAAAVIKAAGELHIRVPEDISVVGFDNTDISTMISPSITTVSQPGYQIGAAACNMLFDLIDGSPLPSNRMILNTEIIVRESTCKKAD